VEFETKILQDTNSQLNPQITEFGSLSPSQKETGESPLDLGDDTHENRVFDDQNELQELSSIITADLIQAYLVDDLEDEKQEESMEKKLITKYKKINFQCTKVLNYKKDDQASHRSSIFNTNCRCWN
jgi:hypothetical protein